MLRRLVTLLIPALLLIGVATIPAGAGPAAAGDGPMIYLARATFDPLAREPAFAGPLAALSEPAPDSAIYLMQFAGTVQDEWKSDVEAAGVELLGYIPEHAFVVRLDNLSPAEAGALPNVRWVGAYRAAYKLEASLDAMLGSDEPISLTINLFPGENRAVLEGAVLDMGGAIEEVATSDLVGDAVRTTLPASRIVDLARLPLVSWVEPYLPNELHNDVGRNIMGVPGAQSAMAGLGVDLYGDGQIISVADTGLDTGNRSTLSLDYRDNFVKAYTWGRPGVWDDPNGHGTHVAGSAAGSGRNSGAVPSTHSYGGSFAGTAPEAGLIFQSLMDAGGRLVTPIDLKLLFRPAHQDGARAHTNSWGHPTGGTAQNPTYGGYDSSSRYADEFMWSYPKSLLLFSAGNNGRDANADGVIDLDQIGSPGTAKNVLTVGATENNRPPGSGFGGLTNDVWGSGSWLVDFPANPIRDDYISDDARGLAAFSSRGPTDDGRIKPDVVAPGTDIISGRSHASGAGTGWGVYDSNYVYMGGTSMSTPLTAGAAALVRQYYADHKSHSQSSAALIKATLVNGAANITPGQYGTGAAREIPATAPNNVIGYGRVNLLHSLGLNANEELLFWDNTSGLSAGATSTYAATVAQAGGSGSQFAATLCWTDYPGTVGAGKELVNDLDLEVVAPGGTHYKGNGKAIWDRYNTCERVLINQPAAGAYQILVRGANVPQGPQPFGLVAQSEHLSSGPELNPTVWLPLIMKHHGGSAPTSTPTQTSVVTVTRTPTVTATPRPTTVTLTSIADATIIQGRPSDNFGTTTDMWVGYDDMLNPDGKIVRSLVEFNLTSIPTGATVTNAKLRIYLRSSWEFPGRYDTITAYRANGNWTESGVTWNNKPPAGAQYGSEEVPTSDWGWYELDVTNLVKRWVNGSIPNQGILLRGEEASGSNSSWRGFSTREWTYPPELTVTYSSSSVAAPTVHAPRDSTLPGLSILDLAGTRDAESNGRELRYLTQ